MILIKGVVYIVENFDKMLSHMHKYFYLEPWCIAGRSDKSYREIQKKFAREGTADATVAAFLGGYKYLDFLDL